MIGRMAFVGPDATPTVIPPPSPSRIPVRLILPLKGTGIANVTPWFASTTVLEYPSLSIRTASPSSTSESQSVIQARRTVAALLPALAYAGEASGAWDGSACVSGATLLTCRGG